MGTLEEEEEEEEEKELIVIANAQQHGAQTFYIKTY
jgi:hypothetical protein